MRSTSVWLVVLGACLVLGGQAWGLERADQRELTLASGGQDVILCDCWLDRGEVGPCVPEGYADGECVWDPYMEVPVPGLPEPMRIGGYKWEGGTYHYCERAEDVPRHLCYFGELDFYACARKTWQTVSWQIDFSVTPPDITYIERCAGINREMRPGYVGKGRGYGGTIQTGE